MVEGAIKIEPKIAIIFIRLCGLKTASVASLDIVKEISPAFYVKTLRDCPLFFPSVKQLWKSLPAISSFPAERFYLVRLVICYYLIQYVLVWYLLYILYWVILRAFNLLRVIGTISILYMLLLRFYDRPLPWRYLSKDCYWWWYVLYMRRADSFLCFLLLLCVILFDY